MPHLSKTTQIKQRKSSAISKYLVYTSAGDQANIHHWLAGYRNFDLWVTYYGDQKDRYMDICNHYNMRKGAKFPNLYFVYQNWQDLLVQYEAVLVMDDDIIISASSISRLFEIREKYALWVLQPAFSLTSKLSHPVTCVKPFTFMRYTNFAEVTCPLFQKDILDQFMKVYNPELVGWGVDWWFLDTIKPDLNQDKVAIVDAITCHNPQTWEKGGRREIDQLQSKDARRQKWLQIKKQLDIQTPKDYLEYGSIKYIGIHGLLHMLFYYSVKSKIKAKNIYRNILRKLK